MTTDWIAERQLEAELPNGEKRDVVVRVARPRMSDDHPDFWYALFEVEGITDEPYRMDVFGPGDSLSALTSAVVHAGLRLQAFELRGIRFTWLGKPGLGFPRPQQFDALPRPTSAPRSTPRSARPPRRRSSRTGRPR